jgi:hypothetical protein
MKNIYSFTIKQPLSALLAKNAKLLVIMALVIGAWGQGAWGANTRYSVAVGDWNSTNTWAVSAAGAAGASVPVAGDAVYIQNGKNVTVTADAAAASITFTGAAATLTINSGFTLTVSGAVILLHNIANATACSITGNGTLSCASVDAGSNLSLNGSYSAIMTSTLYAFNISGDVTMIAKASGSYYGQSGFRVEDGTTTVNGQITSSLSTGCVAALRMNGVTTGLQTGTLVLIGATPFGTLTSVTVVLNGTGSTVEYGGSSSQAVHGTTYTNLKINTGGTATLGAATTVNGIFYMTKGTLALNAKTLTYGASASLNYNGTAAQTTGPEWPASFNKPIIISNTGGVVTLGTATFTGTSASTTINTGATLATGSGGGPFTAVGAIAINGSFQINPGCWALGSTWTYTNGSLIFNNSSGSYGVNSGDVFWPTTNGPTNVNVLGAGGMTLNSGVNRTVAGVFQTSAGVTLTGALTCNGTCQINTGGSFNLAPTYGNSSTLIYNTVSNFAASQEWYPNNSGTGPGVPQNVTIAPGTSLNFGSSNAYRLMRGNLNFSTPYPATSTLALSTTPGGDLYIGGIWNKAAGGTFAPNGRLVKFNGSGSQTITSSGGETFAYLEVNNSSGAVMANNVTLNNTLTLNSGKLAIGANTLTLSGAVASMSAANSLTGSASSNLTLNGSGTLGSLYFDQTASGTTNALQNLTINRPSITVALGNSLLVGGTLTLTDGTLSGPLAFGANGILTYNGTGYSTSSDVEFPASSGPKDVNITVANSSGLTLHANRTIAGNLSIASGQKLIIPADKQLTVTGTLTNTANSGLVIESGASLKNNTSGVAATVKRNIPAWGSVMVGWHLLSSPVSSQAFQPEFVPATPTANEDFYLWDLTYNYWINSKVGAGTIPDPFTFNSTDFGTTFNVGKGYLASYGSDQNKVFAGTLNSGDVTNVALTYASTGTYSGFNLLGNPYPCGLIWGSWATGDAHISATAKILLSANGSYDDISAGGFIPAMNGFFVKTDANTTLTIPASAKDHGGTWLKSAQEVPSFMLTANDLDGQTAQRSHFSINPESTAGFDMKYDGEFMPLYAPEFYSVVGENKLSTNTIPEITDGMVIPMGFVKNGGTNFSIEASDIASLQPASAVYLWDNKTGIKQNLSDNPVYSFTSAEGDAPARFELHFNSSTSVPEATTPETFTVYQSNGMIRISTQQSAKAEILVTNMLGQVVLRCQTHGNSLTTLDVEQLQNGVYVVSLVGGNKVESRKIVVRQ